MMTGLTFIVLTVLWVIGIIGILIVGVVVFVLAANAGLLLGISDDLAAFLGTICAVVACMFGLRTFWRYAQRWAKDADQPTVPRFSITIAFAVAGSIFAGAFMFMGTLLLGHVRAHWMEFGYVPECALVGGVIGALVGVSFEVLAARSRERP